MKKADIASEAERLADGSGWMPAIFRADTPQQNAQAVAEDAEAKAQEGAANVVDKQPQPHAEAPVA